MTVLRDYQEDLLSGTSGAWRRGQRRVLAQLPTGGGKGRILAAAAQRTASRGKTIVIVAHRAELVEQICANLDEEGVPHGRIMSGWPMVRYPVMVGMVQTIVRRLAALPVPDMMLIDECHHAAAGQYEAIAAAWADAHVLGVTATPARTDGQGLGKHFDVMVEGPGMAELIQRGYLADYEYFLPSPDFDMAGVRIQAGDYNAADALRIMSKCKVVGDAVQHYQKHLSNRPAIAFCMGIQHCIETATEFRQSGLRATHVDGMMSIDDRRERLGGLARGDLDVLMAADVISEGVDIPAVGGAILLRPTCSVILHLQQVGRALRVKADGSRAIIMDHVGNARRHGMPADPRKWSLDGKPKTELTELRECESCHRVFSRETAREDAMEECDRAENDDDPCPILAPCGGGRPTSPGQVAPGNLEIVRDPWAWAHGIDPARAFGQELNALIAHADTEERLRMVSRARGYRKGWVQHVLRSRATERLSA